MTRTVSPGLDFKPAFAIQLKQSGKGKRGNARTKVEWTRITLVVVNRLHNRMKVYPLHPTAAPGSLCP